MRNKFNARRTVCAQGHSHASKREARRCGELHLLLRAGEIDALVIEPQYWFVINGDVATHKNGRRIGYKPDFSYQERCGRIVCEDVKGGPTATEAATLRMAIFRHIYPHIELRIVK